MNFSINQEELDCIDKWYEELKPELIQLTKNSLPPELSEMLMEGEVYYGAIGGGLSYTFIPTSLGTILVVEESLTGKKLNVTEATGWKDFG